MEREEYLALMAFPREWDTFELLPDELVAQLIASYEVGHELASEHDRNGAFHWWLKREPGREVLKKLALVSFLDPDQIMAGDVRRYLSRSTHADGEVMSILEHAPGASGTAR